MKKVLFILILLSMTALASAQSPISKGTMTISGSVSYTRSAMEDGVFVTKNLAVNPGVFYYFTTCLAAGIELGYTHDVRESDFSSTQTLKRLSVGPGVKFSYPLSSTMVPFLKAVYRYSMLLDADIDGKTKETIVSLGLDFFLNKHVALQPLISYNMGQTEGMSSSGKSSWIDVNALTAQIGISVFIGN